MTRASDLAFWSDYLRRTLQCYDESLLRAVSVKLIRPRSQWPADELIERSLSALSNTAVIDRRLQDLELSCRRLLACLGHSRQPFWKLGNLLELLAALGHAEGPRPVLALFEAGLLYPNLLAANLKSPAGKPCAATLKVKSFEQWLGQASATGFAVFAIPQVIQRALGTELGLPKLASEVLDNAAVHETDGLEWPLRLAALWQQLAAAPLRLAQTGDFFKRDLDRLRSEPLLTSPPADQLDTLPDVGLLTVAFGHLVGVVELDEGEFHLGKLPEEWEAGLAETLAALCSKLPGLERWDPLNGWRNADSIGNPYPSACLLCLLLLANVPDNAWVRPDDVEQWLVNNHPYWREDNLRPSQRRSWVRPFLLGLAYQLRLLQAAKDAKGEWFVRLSPLGRWMLGLTDVLAQPTPFIQTLLVQPNLEVVVYRQGLTPGLIARLSRFATWKTLGAACTLQLRADRVYRALESGLTFETIMQTLEQQGMRPIPAAVVESLRTWADKRERISIYPAATLFEFASPDDLNKALARGLPGVRLSERLLAVAGEDGVDFRHFRLMGTRDYGLPPEKCVEIAADGVTLTIDLARSDLLLETELQRFADAVDTLGSNSRQRYRLTPSSLLRGRQGGIDVRELDDWFLQRSGQPLSAAGRLLVTADRMPAPQLRKQLIVHLATSELADGLIQWPGTRALVQERLGPTTLAIREQDVELLRNRLAEVGMVLESVVQTS
jgi:hypothetical protein